MVNTTFHSESGQEMATGIDVREVLLKEKPRFHGQGDLNYAVHWRVLDWISANVPQGGRTLETGCGYSTVLLASVTSHHTAITPFAEEFKLIKEWCSQHGIETDHVDFQAAESQSVLPGLALEDLDFVLVDGDHAFPAPFIDWYYTAESIREGGYVAVDDTHIPTGRILKDFLLMEEGRWELSDEIEYTSFFKKISSEPVIKGVSWSKQPYCSLPMGVRMKDNIRGASQQLKGWLRGH